MEQQVRVTTVQEPEQLLSNVYETPGGEAYVIEIPVPGLKPEEIIIEVSVHTVTVRTEPGETEPDPGRKYLQHEVSMRAMSRIFELPREIDTDNVRATLENGLLKIKVPKAIAARRRIIRIGQSA